ncbi:MAG: DUF4411 family protein [Caldilineaceae bacterium]|nr:DUF4411 family protein [Caldilineaceae bacterium]MXZ22123.1 DUF4411 family protein [Caldilineaceae bacterium SB0665_bin_25]
MRRQVQPLFVLDTNVFIGAHNGYYGPDFCPAFWACILQFFHARRLISIDRVFTEIEKPVDLIQWAQDTPNGFFASSGDQPVVTVYSTIMNWVQNNSQFKPEAKSEFATVADGWLIAYAQAHNAVVVTHELFRPNATNRVLIPNICRQFNVPYLNTFEMLRQLGVRFVLDPTP